VADNQFNFGSKHSFMLQALNAIIFISMVWITVEGFIKFFKTKYNPKKTEVEA
jgi:hypothetical protein